MAADRGLRKLHDPAQLRHRQFVAIEEQQEPAAGGVRQRGEVVEDGGSALTHWQSIYPSIRMEGLNAISAPMSSWALFEPAEVDRDARDFLAVEGHDDRTLRLSDVGSRHVRLEGLAKQ